MANQCNTCGGYEGIVKCSFCPTMICKFCQRHHSEYCELLQKAKKRGEGPTVANAGLPPHRAGHTSPIEPVWEMEQKVGEQTQDGDITWTNVGPVSPIEVPSDVEQYVADIMEMRPLPARSGPTLQFYENPDPGGSVDIYKRTQAEAQAAAEIESALDAVKDLLNEN